MFAETTTSTGIETILTTKGITQDNSTKSIKQKKMFTEKQWE